MPGMLTLTSDRIIKYEIPFINDHNIFKKAALIKEELKIKTRDLTEKYSR